MLPRPATYTQLQPEDRVTLASLKQQGLGIRAMASVLGRNASTISRELQRNTALTGRYGSALAQQACSHRRAQACPLRKLHVDSILFGAVEHFLRLRWLPEQVALALARLYPKGHEYRVSHETIYNCIYAQPVGKQRRELIACLRHAHDKRLPRSEGEDRRGQIPDMLSIHMRPPEIEDRQFSGHWESDLIKGEGNASAVGTLVERSSRLLMLVRLPHPKPATAAHVLQAFSNKLASIAQPMRQSMTYNRGREMAMHAKLTERTGVAVYFCDPHSPWQRGSNENTNGLVRHTCPRAPISRATARSSSTPLQTKSMTGRARHWAYDHHLPSTDNCSSAVRLPQP